jgi:hypothetical protein
MDGEDCYIDPHRPNPIVELLRTMRANKDARQATDPLEKLKLLLEIAGPETKAIIGAVLEIAQDLQARVRRLEASRIGSLTGPVPSAPCQDVIRGDSPAMRAEETRPG